MKKADMWMYKVTHLGNNNNPHVPRGQLPGTICETFPPLMKTSSRSGERLTPTGHFGNYKSKTTEHIKHKVTMCPFKRHIVDNHLFLNLFFKTFEVFRKLPKIYNLYNTSLWKSRNMSSNCKSDCGEKYKYINSSKICISIFLDKEMWKCDFLILIQANSGFIQSTNFQICLYGNESISRGGAVQLSATRGSMIHKVLCPNV